MGEKCCSLGKEKGTTTQNQRSVVQYSVISERRNALCAITQETDLAHLYCGEEIDSRDFAFQGECFRALNSLHSNENIVITKPDKGSGVVILNKNDFIDKMLGILDDPSKFKKLGPTSSNDNTANIKSKLQKRLLELFKEDSIPKSLYQNIRPTGSQRPRMYGLPEMHKTNVPLRPILSMTGSSHHELSKWLANLLEPVLKRFFDPLYS